MSVCVRWVELCKLGLCHWHRVSSAALLLCLLLFLRCPSFWFLRIYTHSLLASNWERRRRKMRVMKKRMAKKVTEANSCVNATTTFWFLERRSCNLSSAAAAEVTEKETWRHIVYVKAYRPRFRPSPPRLPNYRWRVVRDQQDRLLPRDGLWKLFLYTLIWEVVNLK